jgi:hypothetical protein
MVNKGKQYPVPKFNSLEEEDKYWRSHSPLLEGYEGKAQKKKQNRASFLSIRLTGEELAQLRERATHYGLGPSTYARQVLIQAMEFGVGFLPSSLIYNTCSNWLDELPSEQRESCYKVLNEVYKNYLDIQDKTAKIIASLFSPNLLDRQKDLEQYLEKEKKR